AAFMMNCNPDEQGYEIDPQAAFEHWARDTPNSPAFMTDDCVITYSELDAWASAVAQRLSGCRSNSFVVIDLPRSVDAIVAVLATLKSGKCFVPIDQAWPVKQRFSVF